MGDCESRAGLWRALVETQRAGKIRAIGVSNFGVRHREDLKADMKATEKDGGREIGGVIAVNQGQVHPWCARTELMEWCRARGIAVQVSG
jgi:diketogulonate reductase-like aldo/keto reductase